MTARLTRTPIVSHGARRRFLTAVLMPRAGSSRRRLLGRFPGDGVVAAFAGRRERPLVLRVRGGLVLRLVAAEAFALLHGLALVDVARKRSPLVRGVAILAFLGKHRLV